MYILYNTYSVLQNLVHNKNVRTNIIRKLLDRKFYCMNSVIFKIKLPIFFADLHLHIHNFEAPLCDDI